MQQTRSHRFNISIASFVLLVVMGLCFVPERAMAQQMLEINGTVTDEDAEPVAFVNILNRRTLEGSTTDPLGFFRMIAQEGDTLVFSYVGFTTYLLVLPTEVERKSLTYLIELSYETKMLRTIEVIGYRERGSTIIERQDNKNRTPIQVLPKNPVANPFVGKLADGHYIENGVYMMPGPFTLLHETFGKAARQNRKIARLDARIAAMNPEEELNPLNPEWVSELTGYEGDRLKDFMMYCFPSKEYLERVTEYELAKYVLSIYKEYDKTIWSYSE